MCQLRRRLVCRSDGAQEPRRIEKEDQGSLHHREEGVGKKIKRVKKCKKVVTKEEGCCHVRNGVVPMIAPPAVTRVPGGLYIGCEYGCSCWDGVDCSDG